MEVFLVKALQLVLALSILVIVHEFGHFIFARIFKVRVEKFYLFFNPWFSLFKFKPKNSDTEYGVGWLPLGGYVKIAGMIDESMDKEQMALPAQPWEFRSKSAFARLMIMIGGVLFNFILAIIIYAAIAFHWGDTYLPLKNVTAGMEFGEVALGAGFKNGDILIAVDNEPIEKLDIQRIGEAQHVTVLRNGENVILDMPNDLMQQIIAANTWFAHERVPFVINTILKESNAAKAGLMANDSVISVAGIATPSQVEVTKILADHKGESLDFSFYRSGELLNLPVSISSEGTIGVGLKNPAQLYDLVNKKYTLFEAIPAGISKGVDRLSGYVSSLK
ncbi:MAG: RIP metalloprotease RseP, partial [Bacteroidales bacterium]